MNKFDPVLNSQFYQLKLDYYKTSKSTNPAKSGHEFANSILQRFINKNYNAINMAKPDNSIPALRDTNILNWAKLSEMNHIIADAKHEYCFQFLNHYASTSHPIACDKTEELKNIIEYIIKSEDIQTYEKNYSSMDLAKNKLIDLLNTINRLKAKHLNKLSDIKKHRDDMCTNLEDTKTAYELSLKIKKLEEEILANLKQTKQESKAEQISTYMRSKLFNTFVAPKPVIKKNIFSSDKIKSAHSLFDKMVKHLDEASGFSKIYTASLLKHKGALSESLIKTVAEIESYLKLPDAEPMYTAKQFEVMESKIKTIEELITKINLDQAIYQTRNYYSMENTEQKVK